MNGDDRPDADEPRGGAEPVKQQPPDQPPGKARGPIFLLIAIIGALLIFAPIAWAFITLVATGSALSATAKTIFWIIWSICLIAFIWIVVAIWRRAA
jgi:hypothetical protein